MHCLMELSGGVVQNTSNRRRSLGRKKMLKKLRESGAFCLRKERERYGPSATTRTGIYAAYGRTATVYFAAEGKDFLKNR